jgi:hypothetical protein
MMRHDNGLLPSAPLQFLAEPCARFLVNWDEV